MVFSKPDGKEKIMYLKNMFVLIFLVVCFVSSAAFASGGDSNEDTGDGTGGGGSFGDAVDRTYESGKSIYTGRKKTAPKLSYCLRVGEEIIPVKRKSLKQFKGTSFTELSKHLFRCDEPTKSIISELERTDFIHVIYYLDKRYRLKLERA